MMMRPALPARALPLAAALLVPLALPAFAQGTPEQREACAPDAVRLCPDTIPDVGRTKACMTAHQAELSPRCHTAFLGATTPTAEPAAPETTPAAPPKHHRVTRAAPADAGFGTPIALPNFGTPRFDTPSFDLPDTGRSRAETRRVARRARVVVHRLCRESVLDASTCAFTNKMIDLAR